MKDCYLVGVPPCVDGGVGLLLGAGLLLVDGGQFALMSITDPSGHVLVKKKKFYGLITGCTLLRRLYGL